LSFSLAVAAVTIIGLLMEAGVPAAVALAAAGVSSRKQGALSGRGHRLDDDADQDGASDRQPGDDPFYRARGFPGRAAGETGSGQSQTAWDIAAERAPETSPVPPHPIALPVANAAALDRAI
jgi:hypothetical protein